MTGSAPARSTASAARSARTTAASSPSTCSSRFRSTAALLLSSAHPVSPTPSASYPRTRRPLQTTVKPNVFALRDATDLPTSKAGSVTHFEAEILSQNIARYFADRELERGFDGHASCFIETGFHEALLIDFNYETEPLPGHFPSALGLPLLRESLLNHLGKLAFQWVYWHALLPGREIPGSGRRCRPPARSASPSTSGRGARDVHDPDRRGAGRRRRRRLPHRPGAMERADRRGDRRRRAASQSSPSGTGSSFASCATGTCKPEPRPRSARSARSPASPIKELYQLFPKGPAKLAAKIGGIPKPKGCI